MKTIIKISGYLLATLMVLLFSQLSVLAAGEPVNNGSTMTFNQVVGGLAILLLAILVPLLKGSRKHEPIKKV
jgi:uncharacterized integral membrane protein